jgi:hypothetical protein
MMKVKNLLLGECIKESKLQKLFGQDLLLVYLCFKALFWGGASSICPTPKPKMI